MSERTSVWKRGAPPAVGWWPASGSRDRYVWRWWNGRRWSLLCFPNMPADRAAEHAAQPSGQDDQAIEWRDWPPSVRHQRGYPLLAVPQSHP